MEDASMGEIMQIETMGSSMGLHGEAHFILGLFGGSNQECFQINVLRELK